ncbi:hypothetical protein F4810DRAFT_706741 [Camillea tinctor]|nr:hypothetical protein F4810DRAFT_706741 [Camillea tinctor]
MRFQSALAVIGVIASAATVTAAEAQNKTSDVDDTIVPGAYIVEFEGDEDPQAFYQGLNGQGINVEHRMDLKYKLFKGASFNLRDDPEPEVTATKIVADARVKSIWPVRKISFPKPDVTIVGNATATMNHLAKRQDEPKPFIPHVMTQVDKLLAEGYTGKGFRIGIVDTGVDYKHPALGGCFGPGCLVEYGYDLNGDDDTSPTPIPDPDPYDGCMGHGTHVAGIIAAQANPYGFTGAAPGVKLGMYKASGCGGFTTNEILLAGFNMAFEDGSDIISCSAGDDSGWAQEPWAVAASRIAEAGVPVIVAPGNSGHLALWNPSTPASGINVTAIGSVENEVLPTLLKAGHFSVNNKTSEFGLRFGSPSFSQNVTLPLWAVSNNTESDDDACGALPDTTPDLSDKIVLLRLSDYTVGGCTPDTQATNLAAKGAQWLLMYSNKDNSAPDLYIYNDVTKGSAGITAKQGAALVDLLNEGNDVTVTINDWNSADLYIEDWGNSPAGGYTSRSSSWGPTWEIEVKPQFTTPGGDILSTYPLRLGAYAVLSGTSMSTPLASAIFALIGEVRGTLDPQTLRALLSATAKPKVWFDGETAHNEILAPVAQQGAGLAQAYDAAFATTILGVSSISFNDSDHFVGERTFTVHNTGSDDVTYTLGHTKALTVYTLDPEDGVLGTTSFPPPVGEDWASIAFASDSVTVPAGATGEVKFTLTPPGSLNATLLPVYSGYITLNSTRGEALSLPYLGVLGSLHDTPTVQPGYYGGVYLTTTETHFNIPAEANRTFTVNRPGDANSTGVIYPALAAFPTLGAPEMRADVVALTPAAEGLPPATKWLGYDVVGSFPGFPLTLVPLNGNVVAWNGRLDDGSVVPEGSYAFVVSAVRVFGDAAKEEDWVAVETVPFILKYSCRKAKKVLIHSAAGSTGQAAVEIAKMLGADIFVTVGYENKKELLMEKFGITPEKIFYSRDTSFAEGKVDIMANTSLPMSASRRNLPNPRGPIETFSVSNMEAAFIDLQSDKNMGRNFITVSHSDVALVKLVPKRRNWTLSPDASYLVAGGHGGLGRELCLRLADKGGTHLILSSISGSSSRLQPTLCTNYRNVVTFISQADRLNHVVAWETRITTARGTVP